MSAEWVRTMFLRYGVRVGLLWMQGLGEMCNAERVGGEGIFGYKSAADAAICYAVK